MYSTSARTLPKQMNAEILLFFVAITLLTKQLTCVTITAVLFFSQFRAIKRINVNETLKYSPSCCFLKSPLEIFGPFLSLNLRQ